MDTPSHGTPATPSSVSADESSTPPVISATNPLQPQDSQPLLQDQQPHPLPQEPPAEIELGPDFPTERLNKLDEQLSRPKWVVPVRPRDDLEMLLRYSIKLCKEGE